MSDAGRNSDDYCYRHPDRLSFVLCERCGRTICLECQHHVDGKVLCPDDAKVVPITVATGHTHTRSRRVRKPMELPSWLNGHPVVSYAIIALVLLIFIVDTIARDTIMPHLWVLTPSLATGSGGSDVIHQPWSLVTSMFSSSGFLTVLLGALSMWSIGRFLEPHLGRQRYIALYVVSGLGASVFAFLLDGYVISWFGATLGLAGAMIVLARRLGLQPLLLYISCGITILFSAILGGWQQAIGGMLAGVAVGFIFFYDDDKARQTRTRTLLVTIGAVLLVLAIVRAVVFPG
jgi:membrane associated rhomboid family serine protease